MKNAILILGVVFSCVLSSPAQTTVVHDLTMWTTGTHTLWDGNPIRYYGFAPGRLVPPIFPGPILYANEGDSIIVNVRNQSQQAPHTIHWHGLDVDQANDGVPSTSFSIYHLQDTNYKFIAPHAGTYLYHCHVASIIHVQMGMYGNMIIRPAGGGNQAWTGGPSFDKEYNWLMSEFDKSWHDTIPHHDTTDMAFPFFRVPPYEPDYFLINGLSRNQLTDSTTAISAMVGEKVYLRLSNVGFFMNKVEFPPSLDARVISSDGRKLPVALDQDSLWLTPGERYGVMLSPSQEIEDSIHVNYVNLNNYQTWDTELVPISVNGFVGVESPESQQLSVAVFPNPNSGEFSIRYDSKPRGDLTIELFDLQGRLMHEERWSNPHPGNLKPMQMEGVTRGIYILRVRSDQDQFQTKLSIEN